MVSQLLLATPHRPRVHPYTTLFRSRVPAACLLRFSRAAAVSRRVARFHRRQDAGQAVEDDRQADGAARVRQPLVGRSEEHTSELQSLAYLVCRLLLEKKKEADLG